MVDTKSKFKAFHLQRDHTHTIITVKNSLKN